MKHALGGAGRGELNDAPRGLNVDGPQIAVRTEKIDVSRAVDDGANGFSKPRVLLIAQPETGLRQNGWNDDDLLVRVRRNARYSIFGGSNEAIDLAAPRFKQVSDDICTQHTGRAGYQNIFGGFANNRGRNPIEHAGVTHNVVGLLSRQATIGI